MKQEILKCKTCNHEEKYHAIPEKHILGTSHCSLSNCECKEMKKWE